MRNFHNGEKMLNLKEIKVTALTMLFDVTGGQKIWILYVLKVFKSFKKSLQK